jgi:hypothetical protein
VIEEIAATKPNMINTRKVIVMHVVVAVKNMCGQSEVPALTIYPKSK